ncbi:hypothetical protein JOF56_006588 [Kibdelosporangium banguiense]|uniref:DUF4383 domain-containing protein n=1 Tax=Kibdelosporangium banguiense TaxID=1365924 RepID=A0ABS4TP67_9PSEU|nr:DUF4383 domain-containing protein [Kibdelosporangium banguiense]MBP2326203.1 hypothetical protein [Kibdelosporangium banguiense]
MKVEQPARAHRRPRPHPGQQAAAGVGAVFLLLGLLGFTPGITSGLGQITVAGQGSGAMLLGVFLISVLHNVVHLAFGVAGLRMGRTLRGARRYLLVGGLVYLLLYLYGMLIDLRSGGNFMPVNDADNWLHLVLGTGMIALSGLTLIKMGLSPSAGKRR